MFSYFSFSMTSKPPSETDPFLLPIQHLDPSQRFILNDVVSQDLELTVTDPSCNSMYSYLMNPKTPFEESVIRQWKGSYTTNIDFLEETQAVIQNMGEMKESLHDPDYSPNHDTLMEIWKDTKKDPYFLERYSYMEIDMFKWVNKMPSFLQAISIVNMGSPIMSFLIPFVLFLLPFIIVNMQGHPVTFSTYIQVLKEISRNHFIGKMIHNAENINFQNVVYLFALIGLYGYQIYQNYIACCRFYTNINKINENICELQRYLDYTLQNITVFSAILKDKPTYAPFLNRLKENGSRLKDLQGHIQGVRPFKAAISKISKIGTLLECYYEIHSNVEYGESILYSFSFYGYIKNLWNIFENIQRKRINMASFRDASNNLVIKDQYYPPLLDENYVTNDVVIGKNMVVTGPNAAGKTTYLKTTMLNIIFSQQVGCGFYAGCKMKPYTHLHSYLNIPDTSGRDSLFQAESRRCKEIIDDVLKPGENPGSRHFCIFDELYSGTNPGEATKSAYAFLVWLAERGNVDFILTTHYTDMCSKIKKSPAARICNWKMDAKESVGGENIEYTYKIVKGVSKIQGAIKVLRAMNYPQEIIDNILQFDVSKPDK